ncbi:MAG: inositol monophosphatase family protein [Gemmatimonadales bacterium]
MASSLDLLHIATGTALAAAGYLRTVERPGTGAWNLKGPNDFVTLVDRAAEEMITERLLREAPGSRVIGEELASDINTDGLTWVVDPLDGTTNYLHGFPAYAVSVAAAVDGVLEAGVIVDVVAGTVYRASAGNGAWAGDRRLAVSEIKDPVSSLIGTGFPFTELERLTPYLGQLERIIRGTSGVRRAGSAALDLASVASGAFEGFWEQHLSAWDIAAGIVLVREAGGRVTDMSGRDLGVEHGAVVAGNRAVHGWLLEQLQRI